MSIGYREELRRMPSGEMRRVLIAVVEDEPEFNPLLAAPYAQGGLVKAGAAYKVGNGDRETFVPKVDPNGTRVDEQRELATEALCTDHIAAIFAHVTDDYTRAAGAGAVHVEPIGNGDFRVIARDTKGTELATVKVYSGAKDDWMRVEAAKMREAVNSKIPAPAPTGLAPADSSQRGRPWGM